MKKMGRKVFNYLDLLFNFSQTRKIFKITTLIFVWLLFFSLNHLNLDPDLGWHIQMGNLILKSGIPATDPFSYTMPHFPFVDHEWLSNIIIAVVYSKFGLIGLDILYATLVTLLLKLIAPFKSKYLLTVPLIFLSTSVILAYSGLRPQIETWVFIGLLINIIYSPKIWEKWKLALPIMFLFWTNLHGGFFAGIIILWFHIILNSFKEKRFIQKDFLIGLACIIVTFINPYGPRIWNEVFMQLSDTNLRVTIGEWMPLYYKFSLSYRFGTVYFITLAILIIAPLRKRFTLTQLGLVIGTLIASISSRRNIPLFIIVSLPLIISALEFSFQNKQIPIFRKLKVLYIILLIISFLIFIPQSILNFQKAYSTMEDFNYPKRAIEIIKEKNLSGQIFTDYGWGGYLIWKLPDKKVFMDGRMPSWRWDSPNVEDSDWAFKDYISIVNGEKTFTILFDKYNIKTVLWPTRLFNSGEVPLNKNTKLSNQIKISSPFLYSLKQAGWKIYYIDLVSVIFIKDTP